VTKAKPMLKFTFAGEAAAVLLICTALWSRP